MCRGNKKGTRGNTCKSLETLDFARKKANYKRVQFPPGPLNFPDFMRVSGIRGSAREHLREHKQTFDKKIHGGNLYVRSQECGHFFAFFRKLCYVQRKGRAKYADTHSL